MVLQARAGVRQSPVIPKRPGPRQDVGYFGPGSITWELAMGPAVSIGGMRNIVFTALSSEVSQAVVDHSAHFTDPLNRAQETLYGGLAMTLGDSAEAQRAGKWIFGKHAKVKGHDPVSRTEYHPMRPDLAISAHGLIIESSVIAHHTYVRRLSLEEREQAWREGLIQAELIGMDPTIVPQTWGEWREHYKTVVLPHLNHSAPAHRIVDFFKRGSFLEMRKRPVLRASFQTMWELSLATIGPTERSMLRMQRTQAQLAVTRQAGRALLGAAGTAPGRRVVESVMIPEARVLLEEAREISRHPDSYPAAPPLSLGGSNALRPAQ